MSSRPLRRAYVGEVDTKIRKTARFVVTLSNTTALRVPQLMPNLRQAISDQIPSGCSLHSWEISGLLWHLGQSGKNITHSSCDIDSGSLCACDSVVQHAVGCRPGMIYGGPPHDACGVSSTGLAVAPSIWLTLLAIGPATSRGMRKDGVADLSAIRNRVTYAVSASIE